MTNGGPINATSTVAHYLYQYGFKFFKMGYACAAAYVMFIIVLVLSMIQNAVSRKYTPMTL
jgi:ABC-type sugar transport system permease subunit